MVTEILQFLIHNHNMKQLSTKEDMLKIISKRYENYFPEIFCKAFEKTDDTFAVEHKCASEEDIWKILKKKQIYPVKKHFISGELWKLLTQDLVRLKYQEYRQVTNSDPPSYEFLWSP
ncbi:hypothetical protein A6R68_15136 [Neotoma lepida]|uniref:MAGE domain-containing protein n=1 Tax=Neotoma lepida TaxID=56216 RepID=A0A1A6H9N6_NEOLE|nr:hypothetical protein A6R68_15136 [Neotoma lepida]